LPYQVVGSDGSPLDAHFDVSGCDIVLFSRGGKKNTPSMRNQAYGPALRLILQRLSDSGAKIAAAWIDSSKTASIAPAEKLVLSGSELELLPAEQFTVMSENMRRFGRPSGAPYGGSPTKRVRIRMAKNLGAELAEIVGGLWVGDGDTGLSAAPSAGEPLGLTLLSDLEAIDQAVSGWVAVLNAASRVVAGSKRWLPEEAVMLSVRRSAHRPTGLNVELGVRSSGEPWSVQLNAPRLPGDANGLTAIGINGAGDRYLLRQGRLQPNEDSDGLVKGDAFRLGSGLAPVLVTDESTPLAREWYVVADLDAVPAVIRRQTGEFVHACARARAASLGLSPINNSAPIIGADEKGGSFWKKAVEAKPEQEVRRVQGEVWLALRGLLEASKVVMNKPRHEAGYEVDGVVYAKDGPILMEIKTGVSAADIYEGVGQLMLYPKLMDLKNHRLVLLLPEGAPAHLSDAVRACNIELHRYDDRSTAGKIDIRFDDRLLKLFGAKIPMPPLPN